MWLHWGQIVKKNQSSLFFCQKSRVISHYPGLSRICRFGVGPTTRATELPISLRAGGAAAVGGLGRCEVDASFLPSFLLHHYRRPNTSTLSGEAAAALCLRTRAKSLHTTSELMAVTRHEKIYRISLLLSIQTSLQLRKGGATWTV